MKRSMAALMAALMMLTLCACGSGGTDGSSADTETDQNATASTVTETPDPLPGVVADFTAEATKPLQDEYQDDNTAATGTQYALCFYDWNEDGTAEKFYLKSQDAADGVTDLGGITAFIGTDDDPDSTNGRLSSEYIEGVDISAVEFVGWIDLVADDAMQELVISAKKSDGTEQTLLLSSTFSRMGPGYVWTSLFDGAFKSWTDGVLTIGDVQYGIDAGPGLIKPLDELES